MFEILPFLHQNLNTLAVILFLWAGIIILERQKNEFRVTRCQSAVGLLMESAWKEIPNQSESLDPSRQDTFG